MSYTQHQHLTKSISKRVANVCHVCAYIYEYRYYAEICNGD